MTDTFIPDPDVDPNVGESLPVQTTSEHQTTMLERYNAELAVEQDKREPLVNSIEHGATIYLSDVEKVAAATLVDAEGLPVLRRSHVDNAEGIPAESMAALLRNYGQSSKEGTVFGGNHGQGLVVANGVINPAGMAVLSKTADQPEPYMAYWWRDPHDGKLGLRTFWVPGVDDQSGTWEPVIRLDTFDGIDWSEVWKEAYNNAKFHKPPTSGTVIVELGESLTDSTYMDRQTTYNSKTDEWSYSRWATGQYYNSRFWTLPINVFWGVPGTMKDEDDESVDWRSHPDFLDTWHYRRAEGLKSLIEMGTEGDPKRRKKSIPSKVTAASAKLVDSPVSVTVEVYIRELPPGLEARKLNFPARRKGVIIVDYNDELFEIPEAHQSFGMVYKELRENVWLRIIPDHIGERAPGSVWMKSGRAGLRTFDDNGTQMDLPVSAWAREFRASMPPELRDEIKKLRHDDSSNLHDKKMKSWWEKILGDLKVKGGTKKAPRKRTQDVPTIGPANKLASGGKSTPTGKTRGPNVNEGTHPGGGREGDEVSKRRRAPKTEKRKVDTIVDVPDQRQDKTPEPPYVEWVMKEEDWAVMSDPKWGVIYEDPSAGNDMRGRVFINWHHWHIQQLLTELQNYIGDKTSPHPEAAIKQVFHKSVVSKIGQRRFETSSKIVGAFTEDEIKEIFSPLALTGYLLGRYDHMSALKYTLSGYTGGVTQPDDDEDAA